MGRSGPRGMGTHPNPRAASCAVIPKDSATCVVLVRRVVWLISGGWVVPQGSHTRWSVDRIGTPIGSRKTTERRIWVPELWSGKSTLASATTCFFPQKAHQPCHTTPYTPHTQHKLTYLARDVLQPGVRHCSVPGRIWQVAQKNERFRLCNLRRVSPTLGGHDRCTRGTTLWNRIA